MALRAVFIDKDGTLLENVPYNVDPERVIFTPDAVAGLRRLIDSGFAIVFVSNQSGVARGFFDEQAVRAHFDHVLRLLAEQGVSVLGYYYCPHLPQGSVMPYAVTCRCRKPWPGMFFAAAQDLGIDLAASFAVGDILDDVEAANRAGCRSVLLDNGNETEWLDGRERGPDFRVSDLAEAAAVIIAASGNADESREVRHAF